MMCVSVVWKQISSLLRRKGHVHQDIDEISEYFCTIHSSLASLPNVIGVLSKRFETSPKSRLGEE